ncbi:hypothetical protein CVT24_013307 [Panaeolus cyanescens]|uniref:Uncharacterized protein n=1 Tax=Panaeolus cyanescens TaxID=181874 RepID=A0A409YMG0_9AGAR|nr:hypothetical protein CVT24_013307 [Panaeolus cyanescens]
MPSDETVPFWEQMEEEFKAYPDSMDLSSRRIIEEPPKSKRANIGNKYGAPAYCAGIRLSLSQWWKTIDPGTPSSQRRCSALVERIIDLYLEKDIPLVELYHMYHHNGEATVCFMLNTFPVACIEKFLAEKDDLFDTLCRAIGCTEEQEEMLRKNYKWHKLI